MISQDDDKGQTNIQAAEKTIQRQYAEEPGMPNEEVDIDHCVFFEICGSNAEFLRLHMSINVAKWTVFWLLRFLDNLYFCFALEFFQLPLWDC